MRHDNCICVVLKKDKIEPGYETPLYDYLQLMSTMTAASKKPYTECVCDGEYCTPNKSEWVAVNKIDSAYDKIEIWMQKGIVSGFSDWKVANFARKNMDVLTRFSKSWNNKFSIIKDEYIENTDDLWQNCVFLAIVTIENLNAKMYPEEAYEWLAKEISMDDMVMKYEF